MKKPEIFLYILGIALLLYLFWKSTGSKPSSFSDQLKKKIDLFNHQIYKRRNKKININPELLSPTYYSSTIQNLQSQMTDYDKIINSKIIIKKKKLTLKEKLDRINCERILTINLRFNNDEWSVNEKLFRYELEVDGYDHHSYPLSDTLKIELFNNIFFASISTISNKDKISIIDNFDLANIFALVKKELFLLAPENHRFSSLEHEELFKNFNQYQTEFLKIFNAFNPLKEEDTILHPLKKFLIETYLYEKCFNLRLPETIDKTILIKSFTEHIITPHNKYTFPKTEYTPLSPGTIDLNYLDPNEMSIQSMLRICKRLFPTMSETTSPELQIEIFKDFMKQTHPHIKTSQEDPVLLFTELSLNDEYVLSKEYLQQNVTETIKSTSWVANSSIYIFTASLSILVYLKYLAPMFPEIVYTIAKTDSNSFSDFMISCTTQASIDLLDKTTLMGSFSVLCLWAGILVGSSIYIFIFKNSFFKKFMLNLKFFLYYIFI